MEQKYRVRKAHLDDVKAMHGLLLACARKELLPPRVDLSVRACPQFFRGGDAGRRNLGLLRPGSGLGGSGGNLLAGGARRSAPPGAGAADGGGLP